MMATEIPAAIRPYSMAVAPASSRKKRFNAVIALFLIRGACAFGKGPGRNPSPLPSVSACSAERGLHRIEGCVQLGADALHHHDDGNRDPGRNQTILDGGCTGVVTQETLQCCHSSLPD